jgi:hypothetical protein
MKERTPAKQEPTIDDEDVAVARRNLLKGFTTYSVYGFAVTEMLSCQSVRYPFFFVSGST